MFWSRPNWDPLTSFFLCYHLLFFRFCLGLYGTLPTLLVLFSHVFHFVLVPAQLPPFFYFSAFMRFLFCSSPVLSGTHHNHFVFCSHVLFFFILDLSGTQPTLFFLCSHMFSFFLFWSRIKWDLPSFSELQVYGGYDFGALIDSCFYHRIEIANLLHLMCPLFVMFDSRLNQGSPTPFFFSLSSVLFFVLVPAYMGPTPPSSFSVLMCFFLFWSGLNWDPLIVFFLYSHVLFPLVLAPANLGPSRPSEFSALICSLSFCFGPGLSGTSPLFLSCRFMGDVISVPL